MASVAPSTCSHRKRDDTVVRGRSACSLRVHDGEEDVCGWLQVAENDSLASIAAQFNSTVSELKVVNRLMSTAVFPGQVDHKT